ncbi:hypothetical protein [Cellulomonas citrea]|uniref:hypothetical protein n=1 Tax=Cellulomonas citrea TaxID=1909423 RepID=UPI001358FAE8|nr:hypothetical protein [Cellulomonas citrea]
MSRHGRHHANPTRIGRDHDIDTDTSSYGGMNWVGVAARHLFVCPMVRIHRPV